MIVVLLLVFAVDMLLLCAAGRLLGVRSNPIRLVVGAIFDVLFVGFSFMPGFDFLGHFLWRLCSLLLTGIIAYGLSKAAAGKLLLFALLHLSLGRITDEKQELFSMLLGAAGIGFACVAVGRNRNLVPVELTYGSKTLRIKALRDTGNTLRDPITGKQVLVVSADVAQKLTGLTVSMLNDPVGSVQALPGLRLIPYQTVGNTGFLLALKLNDVKIGNRQGSALIAFSPCLLGKHYQALTGGTL